MSLRSWDMSYRGCLMYVLWETKGGMRKEMITIIIMTCPHFKFVGVPTNATLSDHLHRSDRHRAKGAFINARAVNAELGFVRLKINMLFPRCVATMSYYV